MAKFLFFPQFFAAFLFLIFKAQAPTKGKQLEVGALNEGIVLDALYQNGYIFSDKYLKKALEFQVVSRNSLIIDDSYSENEGQVVKKLILDQNGLCKLFVGFDIQFFQNFQQEYILLFYIISLMDYRLSLFEYWHPISYYLKCNKFKNMRRYQVLSNMAVKLQEFIVDNEINRISVELSRQGDLFSQPNEFFLNQCKLFLKHPFFLTCGCDIITFFTLQDSLLANCLYKFKNWGEDVACWTFISKFLKNEGPETKNVTKDLAQFSDLVLSYKNGGDDSVISKLMNMNDKLNAPLIYMLLSNLGSKSPKIKMALKAKLRGSDEITEPISDLFDEAFDLNDKEMVKFIGLKLAGYLNMNFIETIYNLFFSRGPRTKRFLEHLKTYGKDSVINLDNLISDKEIYHDALCEVCLIGHAAYLDDVILGNSLERKKLEYYEALHKAIGFRGPRTSLFFKQKIRELKGK